MPTEVMHLVLCKMKTLPTAAQEVEIRSLKTVPGVTSISCGENYTSRGQGHNYAIAVTFVSKEAESAYQTHPLHVQVRDTVLKPLLEAPPIAIDYEYDKAVCPITWKHFMTAGFVGGVLTGLLLARSRSR